LVALLLSPHRGKYLLHVLQVVGGNRSRAADAMGIDRRTLYRMAERFGIDLSEES
jgi:transcriptional regulator of acetoin/glycerol metabolism